jgi:hypothetical protein
MTKNNIKFLVGLLAVLISYIVINSQIINVNGIYVSNYTKADTLFILNNGKYTRCFNGKKYSGKYDVNDGKISFDKWVFNGEELYNPLGGIAKAVNTTFSYKRNTFGSISRILCSPSDDIYFYKID